MYHFTSTLWCARCKIYVLTQETTPLLRPHHLVQGFYCMISIKKSTPSTTGSMHCSNRLTKRSRGDGKRQHCVTCAKTYNRLLFLNLGKNENKIDRKCLVVSVLANIIVTSLTHCYARMCDHVVCNFANPWWIYDHAYLQ